MTELCYHCGAPLSRDEIGLTKKLINRGMRHYLCIHCLAEHFCISEEILKAKIIEFKHMGCTLFIDETEDVKDG